MSDEGELFEPPDWLDREEEVLAPYAMRTRLSKGRRHPEAERPFRCPFVPFVPVLGIAFCLVLMFSLPAENWLRLILWLLLGFAVYFGYGRYHSVLARMRNREIQAGSRSA